MLVLLLPLQRSADRRTPQKDASSVMGRVLTWLKYLIHPGWRAETSQEDEDDDVRRFDSAQEDAEEARRTQVLEDIRVRDRRVDRRIVALEEFAEQIRQKRNHSS